MLHPELWHIHRRNAAKAVAVGLFSGLIPGPLQIITAVILATIWRANMPLAILCTFYTNPLTIVPLYFGAFYIGQFLLGSHEQFAPPPPISFEQWSITLQHWGNWLFDLGSPLGLGLAVLACSLAILGYFITDFCGVFMSNIVGKNASNGQLSGKLALLSALQPTFHKTYYAICPCGNFTVMSNDNIARLQRLI